MALHTRVWPDKVAEYEAAHREVPEDLVAAIRAGGATAWTIWRSGTDVFHVIDCDDYDALIAYVGAEPANAAWQTRMAALLEVTHDYSTGSGDAALPMVWEL